LKELEILLKYKKLIDAIPLNPLEKRFPFNARHLRLAPKRRSGVQTRVAKSQNKNKEIINRSTHNKDVTIKLPFWCSLSMSKVFLELVERGWGQQATRKNSWGQQAI
jgi:hypothetical protein